MFELKPGSLPARPAPSLAISGISLAGEKSTDMKSVQDGAIKLGLKSNLALVRTRSPLKC